MSIGAPEPVRHVHQATVGSTNAVALDLACDVPANETLWITADEQTAGRGRRGRAWTSFPGNLYATMVVRRSEPAHPTLPLAAALCLRDALLDLVPGAERTIGLKWPNDLLWNDRKFAGILVEVRALADGYAIAVGFGVNLAGLPPELTDVATSLRDEGVVLPSRELFDALASRWRTEGEPACSGTGTADVRRRWLDHARGVGKPIVVRLPTSELRGTFERMDETGRLILLKDDGSREAIAAGDVFLRTQPEVRQQDHE